MQQGVKDCARDCAMPGIAMNLLIVRDLTHHQAEDDHIIVAEVQVLHLVHLAPTSQQPKAGIVAVLKNSCRYGKQSE